MRGRHLTSSVTKSTQYTAAERRAVIQGRAREVARAAGLPVAHEPLTVIVEESASTFDLHAWATLYVREVLRLEDYSPAKKLPYSKPPFADAG